RGGVPLGCPGAETDRTRPAAQQSALAVPPRDRDQLLIKVFSRMSTESPSGDCGQPTHPLALLEAVNPYIHGKRSFFGRCGPITGTPVWSRLLLWRNEVADRPRVIPQWQACRLVPKNEQARLRCQARPQPWIIMRPRAVNAGSGSGNQITGLDILVRPLALLSPRPAEHRPKPL